jgi:hypothetical protein
MERLVDTIEAPEESEAVVVHSQVVGEKWTDWVV